MTRGLFNRIIIAYAFVFIAAVVFSDYYITGVLKDDHLRSLKKSLYLQAGLIAEGIDFSGEASLDSYSRAIKEATGARVTVILADGTVIGDSDVNSASMDNHRSRQEIQEAEIRARGSSIRRSATIDDDLLYAAISVGQGRGLRGYIRLAVPLTELNASLDTVRYKILAAVLMVLLISGGVQIVQTHRLKKLVGEISGFSAALASGKLNRRLILDGLGEFEDIARHLNGMAIELKSVIDRNREEFERLNVILQSVPDVLFILDADGRIMLHSKAAEDFFGRDEISGRHIMEVMRNPDFLGMMDEVSKTRAVAEREIDLKEPQERSMLIKLSPLLLGQKEAPGLVAIFHDITQIKKVDKVRTDFVANVSHELKTPIASIKGFADTLLEGALDDKKTARRFVSIIKSNSERINSLVDDLMMISKIELGVITIKKAPVQAEELIDHVTANFTGMAAEKGLVIKKDIAPGLGALQADRNRLIQILTNLLDNAIKFTERGEVVIGARLEAGIPLLFVRDTGCGIAHKHIQRLGERFYRVDDSRSRELGGTGLGLAIVKHLVKAHGWKMRINSVEEQGTTVTLYTG